MTIGFSKNWSFHSWHNSQRLDFGSEQNLIIEMILNCDDETIRMFARDPDEFGVYVRTGIHQSRTERRDHVQVVLGSNDPENWEKDDANSGYTAHIIFHNSIGQATKKYEAHLYDGQHHLKRVGRGNM